MCGFINDFFSSSGLDLLFVTETQMRVGEPSIISELLPSDCSFLNASRRSGRGGGILTVFKKKKFHCKQLHVLVSPPALNFSYLNWDALNWLCVQ